MHCEQVRLKILELTLEGDFVPPPDLTTHLDNCPDCRELLARVAFVDGALRALPLEQMPAWSVRRITALPAGAGRPTEPFLPWTLWLPIGSLLLGLIWAYVTLVWPTGPDMVRAFDPRVVTWLAHVEEWIAAQQAMINAVALSVGVGLLFTVLAIGLGLYVGRDRAVTPRHSH